MENFEYCTPTRILFGKGQIERLGEEIKPYGRKILLCYGGGSIKKIGLYDKIKTQLKDFELYELGGIEPNPSLQASRRARRFARLTG